MMNCIFFVFLLLVTVSCTKVIECKPELPGDFREEYTGDFRKTDVLILQGNLTPGMEFLLPDTFSVRKDPDMPQNILLDSISCNISAKDDRFFWESGYGNFYAGMQRLKYLHTPEGTDLIIEVRAERF